MFTPFVSVLIAVHNTRAYLRQCLDSISSQSFQDFEVVCVDDGSTDNSLAVLQSYAARDQRFKVYSQPNQGVGHAKNRA